MANWFDYLTANPVIALALAIVFVLFLLMVFRKLVKWALISFIVLAVAAGVSYNEAQKSDLVKKGEKILRESEETANDALDKIKKGIEKGSK
jgi:hypothetical protein